MLPLSPQRVWLKNAKQPFSCKIALSLKKVCYIVSLCHHRVVITTFVQFSLFVLLDYANLCGISGMQKLEIYQSTSSKLISN